MKKSAKDPTGNNKETEKTAAQYMELNEGSNFSGNEVAVGNDNQKPLSYKSDLKHGSDSAKQTSGTKGPKFTLMVS